MRNLALLLAVTGCGVPEMPQTSIAISGDAALTAEPLDTLFHLELVEAGTSYAFADLFVTASTPGQPTVQLICAHDDTDGDGRLDPHESLRCLEPPTNCFDTSTVGKTVKIELSARSQASIHELEQLATADWSP